jgi:hypothetical protein
MQEKIGCMGRTLLSAAFEVDVVPAIHSGKTRTRR